MNFIKIKLRNINISDDIHKYVSIRMKQGNNMTISDMIITSNEIYFLKYDQENFIILKNFLITQIKNITTDHINKLFTIETKDETVIEIISESYLKLCNIIQDKLNILIYYSNSIFAPKSASFDCIFAASSAETFFINIDGAESTKSLLYFMNLYFFQSEI